ncbi:hypothetical protein AVEN_104383-1 [Araneus ventricosus]|uniref:MADF domain-containing protein n=1 Tax=Araneus ventricosus TaxID=182803 RepID=A0A4Y2M9J7_ARAVE|nr:hypothetical protein AVEN_104383-1 [Araneus ventricosus]
MKTLKERFGKKDIIVSQFMNKLLNLESVKSASNVKALRRLYDEIEIAVWNLEAQGVTKGSFGQLLIPVLLKSIPEEFVLEFNRKKKSKDEICVSDLLDFLKNEIECRESTYLLCQEKKVTCPPRFEHAKFDNKKFPRNVPTAASFNAVDSRTCIFCDKYRNSVSCDKSVSEKLYKLRNDNRCYVCFRKFHVGRNCSSFERTMEWNNELIMEFLDLYELEPMIWNPQNQHHKDRNHVYDAWKRIQSSLSIDFSLKVLKKKKENRMTADRKFAMKVRNSTRTGAGVYQVYKPEWFAYEKIASFLHSVYTPRRTKTTEKLENEPDSIECDQLDNDVETPDVVDQVESPDINSISQVEERYETAVNEGGPPASKKSKAALVENRMNEAYLLLKQVASKPKVAKDESQLFCDLLCLKLRALDEDTRERAMYEMNNLMFRFKHS